MHLYECELPGLTRWRILSPEVRKGTRDGRQTLAPQQTKPKNIALFIDGTWNRPDTPNKKTNVAKLHVAAQPCSGASHLEDGVPIADGDSPQVVHYLRGVGTGGAFDKIVGGVTGFGSAKRIKEAYLFLARNFNPGDRVYLFGFSRGAFAARALAGFVGRVGLLFKKEASRSKVARAYALYEDWSLDEQVFINAISSHLDIPREEVGATEPIPIHFIGVWDTVKRLGIEVRGYKVGDGAVHDRPALPRHITHARHALALHDLRPEFEPTLWEDWQRPQSMQQVWFRGAHSDVGGSYRSSGLSNVALDWMAREAISLELLCDARQLPTSRHAVRSSAVHFAHLFKPFAPRHALSATTAASSKRLIESFFIHETASMQLLSPSRTHFTWDQQDLPSKAARAAAVADEPFLADVDRLTLALHLELTMKYGKRPAQ